MRVWPYAPAFALAFALEGALPSGEASAGPTTAATAALRWTDETPDAMVDHAQARALRTGAAEEGQALAALAVLVKLAPRATYDHGRKALLAVAAARTDAVGAEAELLALSLAPDHHGEREQGILRKHGVVQDLVVVGPFRDNGGGLDRHEGPEGPSASFGDGRARYAWGAMDVTPRVVPRAFVGAAGVPLDLLIHPRKESCTYAATSVTLSAASPVVVRLAAAGQARLVVDGHDVARGDDVHGSALFDRLAVRAELAAGPHLVVAKVCSGALADDGDLRLRITGDGDAPLTGKISGDLRDPPKDPKRAPGKVTAVVTPLGKVLAANPADGDHDGLLAAAVVRTFGGADDLRSPRAPGVLDRLTRARDLRPDAMAMAGWVAPSGANRSGWLNGARARAAKAADTTTEAFVARRLVAEHLGARMSDWAMATYRGAGLQAKTDDEAKVLGAMVLTDLGAEALRVRALRALEVGVETRAPSLPDVYLEQLSTTAAAMSPARALWAREVRAQRGDRGEGYVRSQRARGRDAVVTAAKGAFDGRIDDADEAIAIAGMVRDAGAYDAARELFAKAVSWAPNRAEAWAGLASSLTAGSGGDANAAALAALRRARELSPGDARHRAELALRQGVERRGDGEHDDERYIVPSSTILARRVAGPGIAAAPSPDVADRQLHWLRAVELRADKRVSQVIHYAREIVIAPRTQEELVENLPAEGDLTEILRARVHRKDGGTAFPTEEHNDGARPRIRWPDLTTGDVVEVALRTWTDRPVGGRGDPPFYFLDYSGSPSTHPLLYNEVVVESSPTRPIHVDVLNGAPDRRLESDERGRHVTRLIWDRPIMVPDEPLSPALSEIVPLIVGSTFRTWGEFREWYQEAIKGFTEPDEQVQKLARDLTKGKVTREQKLEALFNFVADDIRYVNYVSGEWWLPNRPQQLLARREGDCDDKAILLITLLKAVGVEAQEVMVQTRLTGQPSVVRAKNVAVPLFDHGIAFLPGAGEGGRGMYLDATSPQSRLGPLPSMDGRAVALRMDTGPAEIVELPASTPEDHGADVTWNLTLKADGAAELTGEERHAGDGAFWLRSYLTEEGARHDYVEHNLVGPWLPTVEVDRNVEFKGDLPKGRAWVRYKAHSGSLARHEDGDLVVPLGRSNTLASDLAPLVKRTLPVVLPPQLAPSFESRTVRITPPPGFHWAELPAGGDEDGGDFGRAHLEVTREAGGGALLVKRRLVFNQSRIPVEKYEAWRSWLKRVDALTHKQVRLVAEGKAR